MHGEYTLMALRIFEMPPIAVLSTGILMASVMLLIIPTMDVNLLKAEDSSLLLEDAMLCESAGSLLMEGAVL